MLAPEEVTTQKPAWIEAFELKKGEQAQALLSAIHAGEQEEIRLRAEMMASVDDGVGAIFDALSHTGQCDDTVIIFLGDNGYFFGEHALGPERRFAYEEGIRSPLAIRYPRMIGGKTKVGQLVLAQDIAATAITLAGGTPDAHVQGRSLIPLFSGKRVDEWRTSFMVEYFSDNAMPWLIGMTYKAIRTERHKYIRWINRSRDGELDEMYDLQEDPYELINIAHDERHHATRAQLRAELRDLAADAIGL
jgi:N-acetylglucosamine-6-sulfatase